MTTRAGPARSGRRRFGAALKPKGWRHGRHPLLLYDAVTGTRIPTDEWTQVVAVNDDGAVRVYLDGVERFNGPNFPDVFTGATDPRFWIGVNHWDPAYVGRIDELEFFDEALTAEDVASLYEAQSSQ